ncbi:MAG: nodulation protein E [Candidatus Thiodiazotropha sp.]|jgi:hypothetical protein
MSLSDPITQHENRSKGSSTREFLSYCTAERERRRNSGEVFDESVFDQAIEMVLSKLKVLAEEGWT